MFIFTYLFIQSVPPKPSISAGIVIVQMRGGVTSENRARVSVPGILKDACQRITTNTTIVVYFRGVLVRGPN